MDVNFVTSLYSVQYSKNGKNDMDAESGALKDQSKQYSLLHLMSKCSDFTSHKLDTEELVSKVSFAHSYNSDIFFTPKFYCKLTGEGIEYDWGASKIIIGVSLSTQKRSVAKFENLVVDCLSRVNVDMCQIFSSKSRRYMLT